MQDPQDNNDQDMNDTSMDESMEDAQDNQAQNDMSSDSDNGSDDSQSDDSSAGRPQGDRQEDPKSKLFVGGISWDTTEDMLTKLFSEVGTVVSATVIRDRHTNRSKGFGFVEMSSPDEAQEATEKFDGSEFDGREITVNIARPKKPRDDRRNDRRGGYRGPRR